MNSFLCDASALVKRYAPETGSPLVDHLFTQVSRDRLLCLMLGAAEAVAALVRKRNRGLLTHALCGAAILRLRAEVLDAGDFVKLPSPNPLINLALPLLERYAINSADAIVLKTALE